MNKRFSPGRILLYATLLIGAVAFSFPFFWMISSSAKVDRELFSGDLTLKPIAPSATPKSPWVDTAYYADLPGTAAAQDQFLPVLKKLTQPRLTAPANLDADEFSRQVERGVYLRLSQMLPDKAWQDEKTFEQAAAAHVSDELLGTVAANVTRRFSIGATRIGTIDEQEFEPFVGQPINSRWENETPTVSTVTESPDTGRRAAADVQYDFAKGDTLRLVSTFPLSAAGDRLRRIRLSVHPDDSWHDLNLIVETAGQKWEASRTTSLANFDWQTLTWQWPSDDDTSLKVRNWVTLKQFGTSDVTDPYQMRLTLSVKQVDKAGAWSNKLKLNYNRVMDSIPFWRYLRVSLFLVIANIALTVFSSSLVAYAFARLNWPGREFCFVLMLATMMIPGQVLMIPHFLIWKHAGAFDTLTPLWLPALFGNAFYIFLLRQFMRGIPPDLEEAARIDGCSFLGIYWNVILPLIKPSLAAIAIFTFMASWNDFFGPLLYIADQRLYPLSFGLYAISVAVDNSPTITMAAGVLMTLPVVAIFFAAQKYFVQGITLTGMKG